MDNKYNVTVVKNFYNINQQAHPVVFPNEAFVRFISSFMRRFEISPNEVKQLSDNDGVVETINGSKLMIEDKSETNNNFVVMEDCTTEQDIKNEKRIKALEQMKITLDDDEYPHLAIIELNYRHDWKKLVHDADLNFSYIAVILRDNNDEILEKAVYSCSIRVGKILNAKGETTVIDPNSAPANFTASIIKAMSYFMDLPSNTTDDTFYYIEEPSLGGLETNKTAIFPEYPISDIYEIQSIFGFKPETINSNCGNLRFVARTVGVPKDPIAEDYDWGFYFEMK